MGYMMFGISTGNSTLDVILIIGVFLLIFIAVLNSLGLVPGRKGGNYTKRQSLLTAEELQFFYVLRDCVNGRAEIFVQVRLADIFTVKKIGDKKEEHSHLNRIKAKSIDFVICDMQSLQFMFAIELDDKTHNRKNRQERDAFVNKLFQDNNIPLLRIPTQSNYNTESIKSKINQFFKEPE